MKRICLYNILPLLCGFLFLACEKEEAGNGGIGIDDPPPITNGNDDITSLIQPQQTSVTFPYQKTDVIGNDLERYTVEGTGDVTLRSSIYPFYAFEKSNSNGDYYLIKAEVSVHNENMYKNSTHSYKREAPFDQWNYYTQRICGYYMREMRVNYELYDKYGNIVGEFPVGHSPTPLTTIGSTTYISGFSWTIGAQIRIGNDDAGNKFPILGSISCNSETIRNIEDMDVKNNSTDNAASYTFIINNLPILGAMLDMGVRSGYQPLLPPPALSVSTNTYLQEFIWRVPSTRDSQGDDVSFTLVQTVEIDYGICHSLATDMDKSREYGLKEEIRTVHYSNKIDVIPPCRIPMGKMKITNRNKGLYVTQIAITKEGETQPRAISKGSFTYGKSFEADLDIGNYKVEFKMGRNLKDVKTYTLAYDVAEVAQDETLELFSDYDFISN